LINGKYKILIGGKAVNNKVGKYSALVTLAGVLGFALSMIIGSNFGSYLSSLFITWGFVPMICSFAALSKSENRAASFTASAFAVVYCVFISAVYFAQLTTVRLSQLDSQASALLDYQVLGSLFFNYNLYGYAFMALATFFTGLTVQVKNKADKWLKVLFAIHGVFFVSGILMPMLGIFKADMVGGDLIGTIILEFWCIYFTPVCVLSYKYFRKHELA
jgi:hypothetical protein